MAEVRSLIIEAASCLNILVGVRPWSAALSMWNGLRDFRVRGQWQNLVKDMRVEEYKLIYDAMMAKGGIYPRNLCIEEPPLTEEGQLELVKHQVNKMVAMGIYTPPPGWETL